MARHRRARLAVIVPAALRIAAVLGLAVAVGLVAKPVWGLVVAVAGLLMLLAIHLRYLSLLAAWLEAPALDTVPDGVGAWGEVFARIYRSRRATDQNERRLLDNEERFRRTISALPEGIVLVNAVLQIEWCNPTAERDLGIRMVNDAGLRLTNLVREPEFLAYMTSGRFEVPLTFSPLGGTPRTLEVRVVEFELNRSIVISRDITERERLDSMRRDFVADVSHELRTPLTVVNGFLEMLIDGHEAPDEVRRRHLGLMQEQAARMHRLVEDLLMLSRLESEQNTLSEESVDVAALLGEVAGEARVMSRGRHLIEVDARHARVFGSRDELHSAIGNLVSNAVRYTPEGGVIRLVWKDSADGGRIDVADTGIGVAPEHLPRLTERFYRVDKSRSRETGGTGLGLAIVKHVSLRHGARLDITSEPGRGSTFSMVFPSSRILAAPIGQVT
ncbi:MAG: phosphate regulon sensor histidine kinase PhoR [Burkholderiaceae bacterium]